MPNPHSGHDLAQLEMLFELGKDDPTALQFLEEELSTRTGKKAAELFEQVVAQSDLLAASPSLGQTLRMQLLGKSALDNQPASAPVKAAQPVAKVISSTARPPAHEAPAMALHEAERVLGLRNDVPWHQVEAARISKVALSNPEATAHLPGPEVARRFADAKNANTAYAVLLRARGLAFS